MKGNGAAADLDGIAIAGATVVAIGGRDHWLRRRALSVGPLAPFWAALWNASRTGSEFHQYNVGPFYLHSVSRFGSRLGPCTTAPAAITRSGAKRAIRKRILNDIARPT